MLVKTPYKLSFDDYDRAYDMQVFSSQSAANDYYRKIVGPLADLFSVGANTLLYSSIPDFLAEIQHKGIYVMHDMPSEEFLLRLANFINRKEN